MLLVPPMTIVFLIPKLLIALDVEPFNVESLVNKIGYSLYNKLPNPSRISGKNRYNLSVNLAKKTGLSTGYTFALILEGFGSLL
jgi:hypothetical protein